MLASIDYIDGVYLKRCDLLEYAGSKGGKAEGAYNLIKDGISNGYSEFVTIGSRLSPQCEIVSNICNNIGLTCDLFMPKGQDTLVTNKIKSRNNCTIHDDLGRGAYTNVLIYRAKKFAKENNKYFIPFGMLCKKNIDIISEQAYNIPSDVNRVVVPVGSGTTMIGIIKGLNKMNRKDVEVVGVITGSINSKDVVSRYVPRLFNNIKYDFVEYITGIKPKYVYTKVTDEYVGNVHLDPIYEGKCKKFLKPNDLLWIVGYHDI